MTPVPPPASPCVRVNLKYTQADGFLGGSRFFLSYAGSAPSSGNCATLASDISGAWGTYIAGNVNSDWSLTEVDVMDIATDLGASGNNTTVVAGINSGTQLPAQTAMNVEYDIARRYRGGKPRMYIPPGVEGNLQDVAHWTSSFVTATNTAVTNFMAHIATLSVGSMGTLAHVNLSYYKGFTNVTNSSGRTRAAPTYRTEALLDTVTAYSAKALLGSQRRRRAATSP